MRSYAQVATRAHAHGVATAKIRRFSRVESQIAADIEVVDYLRNTAPIDCLQLPNGLLFIAIIHSPLSRDGRQDGAEPLMPRSASFSACQHRSKAYHNRTDSEHKNVTAKCRRIFLAVSHRHSLDVDGHDGRFATRRARSTSLARHDILFCVPKM